MSIASDLLQRHFATLFDDNPRWQTLLADDIVWELPYAPALGHPARLEGRERVIGQATWFVQAVERLRFFDLELHPFADPNGAAATVHAEGLIRATGRVYRQEYVVFLHAEDGKIAHIREFFDPTRAAKALDVPLLDPVD